MLGYKGLERKAKPKDASGPSFAIFCMQESQSQQDQSIGGGPPPKSFGQPARSVRMPKRPSASNGMLRMTDKYVAQHRLVWTMSASHGKHFGVHAEWSIERYEHEPPSRDFAILQSDDTSPKRSVKGKEEREDPWQSVVLPDRKDRRRRYSARHEASEDAKSKYSETDVPFGVIAQHPTTLLRRRAKLGSPATPC